MPKTTSKKALRMKLSAQIRDEVHFTADQIRAKRSSFVVFNEWNQNELTPKEKALLWDAMFRYNTTGEEPDPDTLENRFIKLIWLNMKRVFDQNLVNYGAKVKQSEINNRVSHLLAQMEKGEVFADSKLSNDMSFFGSDSAPFESDTGHDSVPVPSPKNKYKNDPINEPDSAAEAALTAWEGINGPLPSETARTSIRNMIIEFGRNRVFSELESHPLKDVNDVAQALVEIKNCLSDNSDEKMGELLLLQKKQIVS